MRGPFTLVRRGLRHYGRTNAAVVLGVATAVAVLSGSLLVGESVRASLAELALARLGRARAALTASRPFRESLAAGLSPAPLLAWRGAVSRQDGAARASDVLIYGVDERFFAFHGLPFPALEGRAALLSPDLAAELQAGAGEGLLVIPGAASDIPGSVLFGRRDAPARRLRLTTSGTLPPSAMGEFALQPTARELRAVFVPLQALQRSLELEGRANALLFSQDAGPAAAALLASARLEDVGLRLRALPDTGALALESASSLLDDETVDRAITVAAGAGFEARPSLIYLANEIRSGERRIPYSLVAAVDERTLGRWTAGAAMPGGGATPVVLNDWAARELGAGQGAPLALDYYVWEESGRIVTKTAALEVAAVVPLAGEAADRTLVPEYPGITESPHIADWDPPFPVDLSRIRPQDEAYWERHRTTPKAFVPLAAGQRLWGHRLGRHTSLRLLPPAGRGLEAARDEYERALTAALLQPDGGAEPRLRAYGLELVPVRERALAASKGSTDFGEYFLYFSAFLVMAALLLAGLFFRLGLEQRLVELGLLRAVGFTPRRLRALFVAEAAVLAGAGAALGTAGAVAYARLILWALGTVWAGAVGTRELHLAVPPGTLAAGAAAGLVAAVAAIAWTLRDLRRLTPRALLAGALHEWSPAAARGRAVPLALALAAAAVLAASLAGLVPATAGFFGGGALVLAAALAAVWRGLRRRPRDPAAARTVAALGLRGAAWRPGRSLVCIGLVAAASFVIVAVGAFRHDVPRDLRRRDSPSGGYTLVASTTLPLHHDPRSPEGRAALGLDGEALRDATLHRFRRSEGEDASCLNLYRPGRPTILGAEGSFLAEGRFAFAGSLARTAEERANPWLLVSGGAPDGVVPVVADATTLQYVLHARLGEERPLGDTGLKVRFVAALRPGLLQGELVTGERAFQGAFPGEEGYRFFLIDAPAERESAVAQALESRLLDFGLDVTPAAARLRAYQRVENTYISTFQSLGALGLLLGTVGLGAVLLRNAFERRRELALLQAVGYGGAHLRRLVLSENALLLGLGLLAGVVPALLAIAPALRERGGALPLGAAASVLLALAGVGLATTLAAVAAIRRLPLLASLRSE